MMTLSAARNKLPLWSTLCLGIYKPYLTPDTYEERLEREDAFERGDRSNKESGNFNFNNFYQKGSVLHVNGPRQLSSHSKPNLHSAALTSSAQENDVALGMHM